jgi:hypothetical protein
MHEVVLGNIVIQIKRQKGFKKPSQSGGLFKLLSKSERHQLEENWEKNL